MARIARELVASFAVHTDGLFEQYRIPIMMLINRDEESVAKSYSIRRVMQLQGGPSLGVNLLIEKEHEGIS